MSSEKTEQPTAKRLRDAREKGDVCKSQDVPSALCVLVVGIYFLVAGPFVFDAVSAMVGKTLELAALPYEETLPRVTALVLRAGLVVALPPVILVAVTALAANLGQVGALFSIHGIIPKLDHLNPSTWFKKVFSIRNAAEFFKNILKVVLLAAAVWHVLQNYLPLLLTLEQGSVWDMWHVLSRAMRDLTLMAGVVFCLIAVADYMFQRWHYNKEHRMTKDEVRREFKEMEGDPQIKGKRKQLHRELLAQGALDGVRKATVLVTNPTHYAVALDYEKGRTLLPVVLAKGEGLLARRMIDVARREGIPVMRNVPLARELFEQGVENAFIPRDLIGPVAEVLRWVQSLKH